MFGCLAFYRDGLLTLVLTGEGDEPWNGALVATCRERHAALIAALPALASHAVLGKWLYVSASHPEFERTAAELVRRVGARDPLVGVRPKPKGARRGRLRPLSKKQKSR